MTRAAVRTVATAAAARIHNSNTSSGQRQVESFPTSAVTPAPHAEPITGADIRNAAEAVTISGCLQNGDDAFWLKDLAGADAPKARSWKSGFLKTHRASIKVADATGTLNLSTYVGQRVTATGTLANRTMQAHSLHRVAASCN
jgi:hypothetical protein